MPAITTFSGLFLAKGKNDKQANLISIDCLTSFTPQLLVVLILIFVAIVMAIVYSHHQMKQKMENLSDVDVLFAREAIQNSVYSSNTTNTPLALIEAQSALSMIDMLIRRYKGAKQASEITGIDMQETLDTITEQRDRILQYLVEEYPKMLPRSDLIKYTGYVKKRQVSRNSGVAHFEPKDEEHMSV